MPLLFMIAGYVHAMKDRYNTKYFLWAKKFMIDIYLPCLYFSLSQWLIMYFIFSVNNPANFGAAPIDELYAIPLIGYKEYWFLAILFFIKIIHLIFECNIKNTKINTFFWIFMCIFLTFFGNKLPNFIIRILNSGIYFHVGYILKRCNYISQNNVPKILYGIIFIFAAMFLRHLSINFANICYVLCVCLALFIIFYSLRITNKFFVKCGVYSMVIYCLHNFITATFRLIFMISGLAYSTNPLILFCVCFPFAMFAPLLVVWLYKHVKFLRWIEYIFYPGKLFYKK